MGKCNFQSCLTRWKTEGLDKNAGWDDILQMMGFDYGRGIFINAKLLVYPEYKAEIIKREDDRTITRNKWGGLEIDKDNSELMSITIEGAVKDRYSWDMIKERLAGNATERLPVDLDKLCDEAGKSNLPVFTGDLPAGFFGALRELIGFENMSLLFFEDPILIHEILDTLCQLWIDVYVEINKRIHLDYIFIWEDMCCNTGPLISPAMFREFLLPRYKRLVSALTAVGCDHFIVDSDGDVSLLVPQWLESGVNIVFPWESQPGLDILAVREQYPTMGILGALDKHVMEYSRTEIDKELDKVPSLLERGRFIPCCDHGVTNHASWDNYRYFYENLRELIYKYPPQL